VAILRVTIEVQRDGETTVHQMGFGGHSDNTEEAFKSFLLNEVDDHIPDLLDRIEGRPTRWADICKEDIFEEKEPDESWKRMFCHEENPPSSVTTDGSIHEEGLDIEFGGKLPIEGKGTIDGMYCIYRSGKGWAEFTVYHDIESFRRGDMDYFWWSSPEGTGEDSPGQTKQTLWKAVQDFREFKKEEVFRAAVRFATLLKNKGLHDATDALLELRKAEERLAPCQKYFLEEEDEEDGKSQD